MSTGRRPPLQLAILISGRGSNMVAIARACRDGGLNARVGVVISDRAGAAGLAAATDFGIEARTVSWRDTGGTRETFERALAQALDAHHPDLIILAGFMRILSAEFVARYAGRMLNIHPSLLPRYRGLHTHRRAIEAGDAEHGASVHFVTAELDGGPVVLQSRVALRPGDTEAELSARVQATEHIIFPRVIAWLADGRLAWRDGQAWFDGKPMHSPMVEDFGAQARD
jgi:phosphoribosylglycinamide formyltransferase 1